MLSAASNEYNKMRTDLITHGRINAMITTADFTSC